MQRLSDATSVVNSSTFKFLLRLVRYLVREASNQTESTERWNLSWFSSWTASVHFCFGTWCCFNKAELCCVVPVSLCFINWMALNQSQPIFDVGCLMMTQHFSVSVENGPDLGWKNLFWLFHLFMVLFFSPRSSFLFIFTFFILFSAFESCGSWRLVIFSDTTYRHLKYISLWTFDKQMKHFSDVLPYRLP